MDYNNTIGYSKLDSNDSSPVYIINQNDQFYSLSNGDTVLKTVFSRLYEAYNENKEVDAKSFLNSSELSKKIATQLVTGEHPSQPNNNTQQLEAPSAVIRIDNTQQPNITDELFDDEVALYGVAEATKRKRDRMKGIAPQQPQPVYTQQPQATVQISPAEMMFKSFKRNYEISINLEFKDMIGNPDFVKMMLENIDGDIVAYYKNIIMNNIMANVSKIENEVESQIKLAIFGDGSKHKNKRKQYNIKKELDPVFTSMDTVEDNADIVSINSSDVIPVSNDIVDNNTIDAAGSIKDLNTEDILDIKKTGNTPPSTNKKTEKKPTVKDKTKIKK